MKIPQRLVPLIECGMIDQVIRPLLSGKEAQVYLVETDNELRAAKVYKGTDRSFRQKSDYTEGRKVRNSRDRRAMAKRSNYGKRKDEETWSSAEADMIYKLYDAGVRVPKPYNFYEGVLVMECIEAPDGGPAPRIADCNFSKEEAHVVFDQMITQVKKMLCADIVHADLSVYNILYETDGPVVIDFPQSIFASQNPHARKILLRDVANIASRFALGRKAEELRFGYELWDLYEAGELEHDSVLTGTFDIPDHEVDEDELVLLLREMEEDDVMEDEDPY